MCQFISSKYIWCLPSWFFKKSTKFFTYFPASDALVEFKSRPFNDNNEVTDLVCSSTQLPSIQEGTRDHSSHTNLILQFAYTDLKLLEFRFLHWFWFQVDWEVTFKLIFKSLLLLFFVWRKISNISTLGICWSCSDTTL